MALLMLGVVKSAVCCVDLVSGKARLKFQSAVQAEWEATGIEEVQSHSRAIKDLAMGNLTAFSQTSSNTCTPITETGTGFIGVVPGREELGPVSIGCAQPGIHSFIL